MADKDKWNIPEGRDPGEFLTDEQLAEYHAERAAKAKASEAPELLRVAQQHSRSAALTRDAVDMTHALGEAELAESKKK